MTIGGIEMEAIVFQFKNVISTEIYFLVHLSNEAQTCVVLCRKRKMFVRVSDNRITVTKLSASIIDPRTALRDNVEKKISITFLVKFASDHH